MVAPGDLDQLLDDCIQINARLSSGARRTLRRFLRLRERHGARTAHYLSADDVELLEDWASTEHAVRDRRETASVTQAAPNNRRRAAYGSRAAAPISRADANMRVAMASWSCLTRPPESDPTMENSRTGTHNVTRAPSRRSSSASSNG